MEKALRDFASAINDGDYRGAAALMTEEFIEFAFGVSNREEVPALMEGTEPVSLRSVGNGLSYVEGSLSIDAAFSGLYGGAQQVINSRWFFVEEDGTFKLLAIMPLPITADVLPDATVVGVQLVDYAFVLEEDTIPANKPIIIRATNSSPNEHDHSVNVVKNRTGATVEQVIQGQVNPFGAAEDWVGGLFVLAGDTVDVAFEILEHGTYFLVCQVETDEGTPHFELGMVTDFTVG